MRYGSLALALDARFTLPHEGGVVPTTRVVTLEVEDAYGAVGSATGTIVLSE